MTHAKINKRIVVQWFLLSIVFFVIGLGWKYTWLGFVVPVVMFVGIVGALSNGRYVCGNLCPRGVFFDRLITHISPQKNVPQFFRNMLFRSMVMILLISFMIYRISRNPHSLTHWGHIFWLMCVVTTIVGVVLAAFVRARTWCCFCPIGTLGKLIGPKKAKQSLGFRASNCTGCNLCAKACPMDLSIISKERQLMVSDDCIKCWECVNKCKRKALYICQ